MSHLIGSTTQHLFWLKIRSTVLISYVRKPACLSQEKVILIKAEKQNIKQKPGKQMLEDIKRKGKQANATKTAPRTDEQELESSRERERERENGTGNSTCPPFKLSGDNPPLSQAPFPSIRHMLGGVSLLASEHRHNHLLLIIMLSLIIQRFHLNISFLKAEAMSLFFI